MLSQEEIQYQRWLDELRNRLGIAKIEKDIMHIYRGFAIVVLGIGACAVYLIVRGFL